MKEFKKCTLIIAVVPGEGYLKDDECEFEHETTKDTVLSLRVVPLPPIYKYHMRQTQEEKSVLFLSYYELKVAG